MLALGCQRLLRDSVKCNFEGQWTCNSKRKRVEDRVMVAAYFFEEVPTLSQISAKDFSMLWGTLSCDRSDRKTRPEKTCGKGPLRWVPVFLLVSAALGSTGCISRTAHQRTLDDLDAATRQGKLFAQEIAGMKAEQAGVTQGFEQCKTLSESLKTELGAAQSQSQALRSELDQLRQALDQAMQKGSQGNQTRAKAWGDLQTQFAPLVKPGQLELRPERGMMAVVLLEAVLFEPEKAELKADGKKLLGEVAKTLGAFSSRVIQVEGHTDNVAVKPGGKYSDLRALSHARALEVTKALEAAGVPARSLSVAGWGESAPQVSNDTAENRAHNRRVSLVFLPTLDELSPLDAPAQPAK